LKRYTDGESVNSVKRYLLAQDAYTLHKQRRIHFPRRKTYSKGIADLYQADLVDMTNISRYNDSYRFLLTIIHCFSKVAWVAPLLTKSADRVTDAFAGISTEVHHAADRSRQRVLEREIPVDAAATQHTFLHLG